MQLTLSSFEQIFDDIVAGHIDVPWRGNSKIHSKFCFWVSDYIYLCSLHKLPQVSGWICFKSIVKSKLQKCKMVTDSYASHCCCRTPYHLCFLGTKLILQAILHCWTQSPSQLNHGGSIYHLVCWAGHHYGEFHTSGTNCSRRSRHNS